jgi:hypothetical protein
MTSKENFTGEMNGALSNIAYGTALAVDAFAKKASTYDHIPASCVLSFKPSALLSISLTCINRKDCLLTGRLSALSQTEGFRLCPGE